MTETANDTQIQDGIFISRVLIIVPFTVLVYEYLLTLEREVSGFWGTRLTWGSFFFYVNRYSPLFGNLPILVQYYSTTTDPDKLPLFVLHPSSFNPIILITRTYALYERNKAILALTLVVTLGAFAFAVWILLSGNDANTLSPQISAFGCPLGTSHAKSLRLAEAWSGMLVFDVMIFGLTLFKALKLNVRRGDLLTILVRDGTVYFALMIISNACNIGTYTMGNPFTRGSATTVTNVVSSVMISRLMFNLRDPKIRLPQRNSYITHSTTLDHPAISTVHPYATEYTMNTQWTTSDD
ncbi:hypothetical protein B0H13DRAFT_2339680 [Mycena leptocephala]|nr:hypothetical protein B0H13DRAFT_2339680 [Mycena leptocephala]